MLVALHSIGPFGKITVQFTPHAESHELAADLPTNQTSRLNGTMLDVSGYQSHSRDVKDIQHTSAVDSPTT